MARWMLVSAALLLAATGAIHLTGLAMVAGWTEGLAAKPAAALRLVWASDSFDWWVVALLWAAAAWRWTRPWLGAATIGALIPLVAGVAVVSLDPQFFGGYLLLGSFALAAAAIGLAWRGRPA